MKTWAWWLVAAITVACGRELDPAACSARFDVQKDKIIRTEESREMGAHYLSELDVGSRDECLRLCCETDQCDVFVYEEKSPGSCYLFSCGPPEDFRCKFTAHGNFSSGVLALSRSLAELQDQERLAQHERELANLRVPTPSSTTVKTPTTSVPATAPPLTPVPPAKPKTPPRRCSRYQFECHTSGECIAVYNACDGVPQCADGSDEAPELGCPGKHAASPTTHKFQQKVAESSLSAESDISPPESRITHWPHRLVQAQPPMQYADNGPSSHIFSHKGGLMQEPDSSGLSQNMVQPYPAFETPWQRRPWSAPSGMEAMGPRNPSYARYHEWEADPRSWPVPQPPPNVPDMPVYMPSKTMPETPMVYSSQQETLRDSPKKGFDLIPKKQIEPQLELEKPKTTTNDIEVDVHKSKENVDENQTKKKDMKEQVPAPVVTSPPVEVKKVEEESTREHSLQHDRYEMGPDDHDGLSEHPPAAVLLLVLGILMTTVMAVMLGCRLRLARRRLRRGKSPFAHDADYLVNGMYL